jgi:hypothetical protein
MIFIAERSRRGSRKLLWSCIPVAQLAGDIRIDASEVPNWIRRKAYKLFERHRNRNQTPEPVASPANDQRVNNVARTEWGGRSAGPFRDGHHIIRSQGPAYRSPSDGL